MATLVPGILLKLLQHMNTDVKVGGEHRSSLLQVVSIVPALIGGDLFQNQGFYLKVSDSSHATYVALPDENNDLILSDEIRLGQYIHVERLEAASPVPILRGVKLLPGRRPCLGTPEDIVVTRSLGFLNGEKEKSKSRLVAKKLFSNEKSPPCKMNSSVKNARFEKKTEPVTMLNSVQLKPSRNSFDRKEAFGRLRTNGSQSIPSSPTSCYSLPTSFERFSSGMKQREKIKSGRGTPKFGLVEKTKTKQPPACTPKKMAQVIDMGPKALRRSWEGIMDTKSISDLKVMPRKQDLISGPRNSTVSKRSAPDNRLLNKVENKASKSPNSEKREMRGQISTRNEAANGVICDLDSSTKTRLSVGRKSIDSFDNGLPGNLVKVPSTSAKLIDASVLRASIPSSVTKLGKEVLKLRDSAQTAAMEAMQEASVADNILQCLSKFSELSVTAKEDDPQPAVHQYLELHSCLKTALHLIRSLSETNSMLSIPNNEGPLHEETRKILLNRRKQAASWVNAALTTNLSPFSMYTDQRTLPPLSVPSPIRNQPSNSRNQQPALVLETSVKNNSPKALAKPRLSATSKTSSPVTPRRFGDGLAQKLRAGPLPEWSRRSGLDEFMRLARNLRDESQNWFLGFVEGFLDANVDNSTLSDNSQIAGMLTQLKRVNDWLDEINGGYREIDYEEETTRLSSENMDRLRKKIYEYLLTRVESAAAALGSCSQTLQTSC